MIERLEKLFYTQEEIIELQEINSTTNIIFNEFIESAKQKKLDDHLREKHANQLTEADLQEHTKHFAEFQTKLKLYNNSADKFSEVLGKFISNASDRILEKYSTFEKLCEKEISIFNSITLEELKASEEYKTVNFALCDKGFAEALSIGFGEDTVDQENIIIKLFEADVIFKNAFFKLCKRFNFTEEETENKANEYSQKLAEGTANHLKDIIFAICDELETEEELKEQLSTPLIERLSNSEQMIPTPSDLLFRRVKEGFLLSSLSDTELEQSIVEQRKISNYTLKIDFTEQGLEYKKGKKVTTFTLLDNIKPRQAEQVVKFFVFILSYARNRKPNTHLYFTCEQANELFGYSTTSSFQRAFDNVIEPLLKMKAGYNNKGDDHIIKATLFPYIERKGNYVQIDLNPRIEWEKLFKNYTMLSNTAFRLSDRTFVLYEYLMYLARQNYSKIDNEKLHDAVIPVLTFNVNLRSIAEYIKLPIRNYTKASTQIKKPLENLITEIEEKETDILLTIKGVKENANIEDWLTNGYLEVKLKGKKLVELAKLNSNANKRKANREIATITKELQEAKLKKQAERELKKRKKAEK